MATPAGKLGIKGRLEEAPPGMVNTNEVVLEDEWPSVLEAVARGLLEPVRRFDVLIAEFRLPGSPSFAAIHAIDPNFSVIDIDMERGTSNTPMFDVGSEKLRRLAEWLTRESGLTSTPVEPAAEPQTNSSPSRPRLVLAPPTAPQAETDNQLDELARWLQLKLGLMLARAETSSPGEDFPGWTMSAARARALLGDDIARLSADGLEERWRRVDARLHALVEAAARGRPDTSPAWIAHAFKLDRVEREMLWLSTAPDMAGSFAQAIGFLNDDLAQRRPTLSLLSRMIDGAGPPWRLQRRLAGDSLFARFRLTSLVRSDPLIPDSLAPVVAAPDLVSVLLGRGPGAVVEGATLYDPNDVGTETFEPQLAQVLLFCRAAGQGRKACPLVHFHAPAAEADWLAAQLASVGEATLLGDITAAAGSDFAETYDRLLAFARAARLADAVLVIRGADAHDEARRADLGEVLARELLPHLKLVAVQGMRTMPTAFRAAAGGVLEIGRPRPTREERASIWGRAAAARGLALSGEESRDLGATFAFDRTQAETAVALALGGGDGDASAANEEALRDAARIVSRASAPAAVRRIETGLGWTDLILPAAIKAELKGIVTQVKHSATVWDDWGFAARIPYGQAMIALLAGPSGTGKTMAAQIIAGELGAALFQVDLAQTVSKYIGETEKALDAIFKAAENASAVLLFDEADALFGKRSDIHDAHDRYANIEVNFLLQRIEEHLAPVLLTTNRKANIDSAFLRRLNKVVDFPMPDEEQRGLIWKRLLPPEAFVADDARDMSAFRQLPLSGGGIANSVLAAAFMGAEDGGQIRMRHLVAAARGELAKGGMGSAARTLTHLIESDRALGNEP